MKKGEKILGKGMHGCAIYGKPLTCLNSPKINDNKLIKILIDKDDFLEEINNTLLINFIDKSNTSIKIEDSCIIDISKITDEDDKQKIISCKLNNTDTKDSSKSSEGTNASILDNKLYQIIYNKKDIGIDLKKLILTNKISLEKILAMSLRLYESLFLYSKYEICFMDLKPDNVIYIKNRDKLKFIDYGIISNYNKVLLTQEYLTFDYPFYPPELKLIYSINNKKNFDDFLSTFLQNFIFSDVIDLKNILFKIYPKFEKDLHDIYDYYMSFKQKYPSHNAADFFSNEDKSKIHLYSLSMLLLDLIAIYDSKNFEIKDKDFVTDFIKNVILPSISFNTRKRFSIEDTINSIKLLKSKNSEINKIIHDENLLNNINAIKTKHRKIKEKNAPLQSSIIYNKDLLENIKKCDKTKSYYLLLAKKHNIKNRYKMKKIDLCNLLQQKVKL